MLHNGVLCSNVPRFILFRCLSCIFNRVVFYRVVFYWDVLLCNALFSNVCVELRFV